MALPSPSSVKPPVSGTSLALPANLDNCDAESNVSEVWSVDDKEDPFDTSDQDHPHRTASKRSSRNSGSVEGLHRVLQRMELKLDELREVPKQVSNLQCSVASLKVTSHHSPPPSHHGDRPNHVAPDHHGGAPDMRRSRLANSSPFAALCQSGGIGSGSNSRRQSRSSVASMVSSVGNHSHQLGNHHFGPPQSSTSGHSYTSCLSLDVPGAGNRPGQGSFSVVAGGDHQSNSTHGHQDRHSTQSLDSSCFPHSSPSGCGLECIGEAGGLPSTQGLGSLNFSMEGLFDSSSGDDLSTKPSICIQDTSSMSSTGSSSKAEAMKYATASLKTRSYGIVSPQSSLRTTWDGIIIVNTIIASVILPLMLVYLDREPMHGLDELLLYVVDMMWPLDILMNFRTGYYSKGEVEFNQWKIAKHYARGWLCGDLLSAWPLALTTKGSTGFVIASIVKFPRLLQLGHRFSDVRSCLSGNIAVLVAYILVVSTLSLHLTACMWRVSLNADGIATDLNDLVFSTYTTDLYFIVTTLSSVGFGDVIPLGNWSKMFAICLMLLGCAVFGGVVTGSSFVLQKMLSNEVENRISEANHFMHRRSVPKDLQRRVRENLRQHLVYSESTVTAPQVLSSLSPAMQRELCLAILSDTVLSFPLFKNSPRSFVAELAQLHVWDLVLPGDTVTDEGYAVSDLVFVMDGSLQALLSDSVSGELDMHVGLHSQSPKSPHIKKKTSHSSGSRETITVNDVIEIRAGAWFGETSLFDEQRVYTALIVAVIKCELSVLAAVEYVKVVHKYPWLSERHNSLKHAILAGNLTMTELRCQQFTSKRKTVRKQPSLVRNRLAELAVRVKKTVSKTLSRSAVSPADLEG